MHMYPPSSMCGASMVSVNLRKWNKVTKMAGHHQSNYQIFLSENLVKNLTLLILSSPEKQYLWLLQLLSQARQKWYQHSSSITLSSSSWIVSLTTTGKVSSSVNSENEDLKRFTNSLKKGENILLQQYMYSVF